MVLLPRWRRNKALWVALAAGCIIANAPQPAQNSTAPQPKDPGQTSRPMPVERPAPTPIVGPTHNTNIPCDAGDDNRQSELCAQWKAADSAADAATWTRWSVIVGALGLMGLLVTLLYTRKAVLAAEEAGRDAEATIAIAARNADAASDLARHSQEATQQDLRAWLGVEGRITAISKDESGFQLEFDVELRNFGRTPAPQTEVSVHHYGRTTRGTKCKIVDREFSEYAFGAVFPGASVTDGFVLEFTNEQIEELTDLTQKTRQGAMVIIELTCDYTTIFDGAVEKPPHKTRRGYSINFNDPVGRPELYRNWFQAETQLTDLLVCNTPVEDDEPS